MLKITTEGFRDLENSLRELPNRTRKSVMTRALRNAAEPLVDRAKQLAPVDRGYLRDSITVGTRLSRRQRALYGVKQSTAEVSIGPSGDGINGVLQYASLVEFGTVDTPAQPFMRSAWDAEKSEMVVRIREQLTLAIGKALRRLRG